MAELTGDATVVLQPDALALNAQMCADYVQSCNNMFDDNIIQAYMDKIQDTDTLTACRAVVKQCFDKYGGTNYENFYYPYSGLFTAGNAPDWFTLYDHTNGGAIKSECARQLQNIDACSDPDMIERAFGGFDSAYIKGKKTDLTFTVDNVTGTQKKYGTLNADKTDLHHRYLRPVGVATEIYNQILSILTTQCTNLSGRFVEYPWIKTDTYNSDAFCQYSGSSIDGYNIQTDENMCPATYSDSVDTQSWGACLCWENGGRRSNNGTSVKCVATIPNGDGEWETVTPNSKNQVCPPDDQTVCTAPESME